MNRSTFIFGVILLLLAPVLWPVVRLMPDRAEREARQLQRETECRKLIIVACDEGDLEWARELVFYWKRIVPSAGPREALVVLETSLSSSRKLAAIKDIAARAGRGPSDLGTISGTDGVPKRP